jgi:hypothetical protein
MALIHERSEPMRPLPTSLVGMLVLLASLLVFPLVLAPRAEAYVYWTSDDAGIESRGNPSNSPTHHRVGREQTVDVGGACIPRAPRKPPRSGARFPCCLKGSRS